MSTRSRVGIETNGMVTSVYVHWDGQPEHHGPILKGHYPSAEAATALIALGDLSILAPELGEQHDFNSPDHPCWCLAYSRDRRDLDTGACTHPADRWPDSGQAYDYVHRDGRWQVRATKHGGAQEWRPL